jgi:hypothetical protein
MLTTEGKLHVKRYQAEYVNSIARSMVFGIGAATETVGDKALQLEVESSPINLTAYDFVNNQIVYKAEIPEAYAGKIYEVGVYSLDENPTNSDYASRLITTFDSASEDWEDNSGVLANFGTTATRVGVDSLLFTPASSATTTYNLNDLELDLSGYSGADNFVLAYNVANSNTSQITVRFMVNSGNYYSTSLGAQTSGYKIVNVLKSAFTSTGTPTWATITKIQILVTSTSGGASNVEFDAIRINDTDSAITDYVLVARKVLTTPVTKVAGMAQDMEYRINFTV